MNGGVLCMYPIHFVPRKFYIFSSGVNSLVLKYLVHSALTLTTRLSALVFNPVRLELKGN